jgi:RNA polymerase sigma-70 factor (ECF subfamily)
MNESSPEVPDEELACRAQSGCLDSFEQLMARHERQVFGYLRRWTGHVQDAEDLTQEAFIRAFRSIGRYRSPHAFKTWLYTIARRSAISRLRALGRRREVLMPTGADPEEPSEEPERKDEERSVWRQARRALPEKQFTALWLKYGEDMSIAEAARVMKTTSVHVKVLLHRGRRSLARRLGGRGAGNASGRVASAPGRAAGARADRSAPGIIADPTYGCGVAMEGES